MNFWKHVLFIAMILITMISCSNSPTAETNETLVEQGYQSGDWILLSQGLRDINFIDEETGTFRTCWHIEAHDSLTVIGEINEDNLLVRHNSAGGMFVLDKESFVDLAADSEETRRLVEARQALRIRILQVIKEYNR
jgi:hypothetical protein